MINRTWIAINEKDEPVALTPEQRAVVDHDHGPALVFAVAGAGKTTAMVQRIERLVREGIFAPERILATSFGRMNALDLRNFMQPWPHCRRVGVRTLHALGRDIIVTASGKNVAPQNIENLLKSSPLISQAMVHGDKRPYLVGLVTIEPDELKSWAAQNGIAARDHHSLCREEKVVGKIQEEVDKVNADLARYETLKKFRIVPDEFTQETGELTPTMKVKRKVVTKKYQDLLDGMYA